MGFSSTIPLFTVFIERINGISIYPWLLGEKCKPLIIRDADGARYPELKTVHKKSGQSPSFSFSRNACPPFLWRGCLHFVWRACPPRAWLTDLTRFKSRFDPFLVNSRGLTLFFTIFQGFKKLLQDLLSFGFPFFFHKLFYLLFLPLFPEKFAPENKDF
jgi:hypothetical protein